MLMMALVMAATVAGSPDLWVLNGQLRLDAAKPQVFRVVGEGACLPAGPLEVPARKPEVCRTPVKGGEFVGLFAQDQEGVSRLVAYSLRGSGEGFDAARQMISASLGAPTRGSPQPFGESLVWMQGARQTSLRSACAPMTPCLEVSKDMTARRLARSGGVFVGAAPGS